MHSDKEKTNSLLVSYSSGNRIYRKIKNIYTGKSALYLSLAGKKYNIVLWVTKRGERKQGRNITFYCGLPRGRKGSREEI